MTNITDTLNLLMFDTSDNTTELFARKLVESGIALHSHRENDKIRLFDAIKNKQWDMLLVGDEVKELDITECLACIRQYKRPVGLAVLTAKPIGPEQLAQAYRQGISALVSLEQAEYSCAAISREFQALRSQKLSARLEFENSELVERCQALMGSSNEAVAYVHDGMHVHANAAFLQKFNFADLDEVLSTPFIDLVHASCRPALKDAMKELQKGGRNENAVRKAILDMVAVDSAGEKFAAQFVFSASQYNGEEVLQVLVNTDSAVQASLKQAADADAETGLYNRQFFMNKADEFIQLAHAGKFSGGMLLCVVVNRFNNMRAEISWDAADDAITQLATYLKERCGSNDVLARLNDDAFAVLVSPGASEEAAQACNTLLAQLAQYRFNNVCFGDQRDQLPHCTAFSMPIDAETPPLRECLTRLLQRVASRQKADAQASAPAAPVAGQAKTAAAQNSGEQMLASLGLALQGDQARMFHRPVISVSEIDTEFHDIELRIPGPDGKLLARQQWLSHIDHHEHGLRADRWQLQQATSLLATLQQSDQLPQFMFTLTGATLRDPGFPRWLSSLTGECDLPATALILNVSAAQIKQDPINVSQQLSDLAASGFRICISEPFDIEEICQLVVMTNASFARFNAVTVRHLTSDSHKGESFSAVAQTLQQAGCRVIVTGADDNRMLSLLWQQKVDLMQGTYFGHEAMEVSADAFAADAVNS